MFGMLWLIIWKVPDIMAGDISSWGLFGMRIFRHKNILAWVFFGTMDISAWGCYDTGKFQNKDISAHGNVPKCPCAEMSICHNVYVAKSPWCWKVPRMKCPCRNVSWQNVRCQNKPKASEIPCTYHKVASSNTSCLETHAGFFRLKQWFSILMYSDLLTKS